MTTPDPIRAVDVTEDVNLPDPPSRPMEFCAQYLCWGRNSRPPWWYLGRGFPTAKETMGFAVADRDCADPRTIRIFQLGGEAKPVAIDWDAVLSTVELPPGLPPGWFGRAIQAMRVNIESQLAGGAK